MKRCPQMNKQTESLSKLKRSRDTKREIDERNWQTNKIIL